MKDIFDNHTIKLNYAQAKRLNSLVEEYIDFSKLTVGDVLQLNKVQVQLEEIIEAEEKVYV